jgi:putative ABC transport system permease protein
VPRLDTVAIDWRALAFLLAVSLATGIGFGLAPALQAAGDSLRARGSSDGRAQSRVRGALVASELAIAVVVLVAAGLMIRSVVALQAIDPGFDPRNVLSAVVSVAGTKEADGARRVAFYQQAVERVRALPGVVDASAINHLPLGGDLWGISFAVEGRPLPRPGEEPYASYRAVLPGYFRAMRIPVLDGRDVGEGDRLGAPDVVVINEFMARRWWPGESALGKRITLDASREEAHPRWLTVVGVAKNDVRGSWTDAPGAEVFLPVLQRDSAYAGKVSQLNYLTLVVRTSGDPAALAGALRAAIASVDPAVTIADVRTMRSVVAESTARPRFYVVLLGAFALVALVLAVVGIYGVMSYVVARRTRELGIRMALGARRTDALGLVIGQSMGVAVAGVVAGTLGALALTRLMASLLYGVRATDPVTFILAPLVLLLAALVASAIPARRATRVDPMVALRSD